MNGKYLLALSAKVILLTGCSASQTTHETVSTLYCDRYLIYSMCAQDLNGNKRADLVYFEDSQQIFLFNKKLLKQIPTHLTLHDCAQSMDRRVIDATSRLLTISESTGFIRRNEIKNGIFFHYVRYLPRIHRCQSKLNGNQSTIDAEDDFGVEENESF